MSTLSTEPAYSNRKIRVFISSTFIDMHEERDELVKFIFPQLRDLCESRGVIWGEVDLRWGITDEESADGQVLPICLAEINDCRPYFICLLGERYGWVPNELPASILESESWLCHFNNKSVTELEILHGVLLKPEMAEHAFFYFRDPAYIEQIPFEQRHLFKEQLEEDKGAERNKKLRELKDSIRNSGLPVRENYKCPKNLGELVLADLANVIETLYPIESTPSFLEQESADHWAFAQTKSAIYIGKEDYFACLDRHFDSKQGSLVVVGDSGLGKTSLLSAWVIRQKLMHPELLIIPHFIGATPYSSDCVAMQRRIMGELKKHFSIDAEIPDSPDEIAEAFTNWLLIASSHGKIVLVLDALNQLESSESHFDLSWLPNTLPSNVRIITSTIPGKFLDELRRRCWKTLILSPLTDGERIDIINQSLRQYSKKLPTKIVLHISSAPQTANPLFLKTLIEELRIFGDHSTLENKVNWYLTASTIDDLFSKVLLRYEADYSRDKSTLVRDALTLVCAARKGLSESELLELLGDPGNPLPYAHWSPLKLASKELLLSRSGLINFFHDYFRKAVCSRYLPNADTTHAVHIRLVEYFRNHKTTRRKLDEYPWQLLQCEMWSDLAAFIANISTFMLFVQDKRLYEIVNYWRTIGNHVKINDYIRNAIADYFKTGDRDLNFFEHLIRLSYLLGNMEIEKEWLDEWEKQCHGGFGGVTTDLLLAKSRYAHRSGNQSIAISYAIKAEELAQSHETKFQCSIEIIQQLAFSGRSNDALKRIQKTSDLHKAYFSKNKKLTAYFHHQISFPFHELDMNDKFAQHNLIARDLYSDLGFLYEYCTATVNLGDGYWGGGKCEFAKKELTEAYEKADNWTIPHAQNITAICLANYYSSINEWDAANQLYESGIKISEKIGHSWDYVYGCIYRLLLNAESSQRCMIDEFIDISEIANRHSYEYLRDLALAYGCISALLEKQISTATLQVIKKVCYTLTKSLFPAANAYGYATLLCLETRTCDEQHFQDFIAMQQVLDAMEGIKGRPGIILEAINILKQEGYHQLADSAWQERFKDSKIVRADALKYSLVTL